MFRRFWFSRIWSSAQDHAVLVLLLNLVGFFISTWPRWSGGNVLYHSCTSFEGASRGGQPLNIFTWFIVAGGWWHIPYFISCCSVLQCVAVCCSVLQCVAVCCSVLQMMTHTILYIMTFCDDTQWWWNQSNPMSQVLSHVSGTHCDIYVYRYIQIYMWIYIYI